MTNNKEFINYKEFEQNPPIEVEKKFMPLFPEDVQPLREIARPIEHAYLSQLDEPFSLRVREHIDASGNLVHTATLKDKGTVDANGLTRIEIEAQITAELYAYYNTSNVPSVRKLRAEPLPGVFVDFYEDGTILAEAENESQWERFVQELGATFIELTGDRFADNEWRAHIAHLRNGHEPLRPDELCITDVVTDILTAHDHTNPLIVRVAGRSGSGKSTFVEQLRSALQPYDISPSILSTDDYHRGTKWLTAYNNGAAWTAWDDAIVYDTQALASDLQLLQNGAPVTCRKFDFSTAEPFLSGYIESASVIIVEGIYAGSSDLAGMRELVYEMPTPLATCIGRRIMRDLRERPEFADPAKSLAYTLSHAEPAYRRQSATTGG